VFSNSDEVLRFISDEEVEYVDIRFCDLPGVMQHLTVPASAVDQDFLDEGIAFDGSSVRGFQAINESDMALFPDPATARVDPFRKHKTLNMNFFVHDPLTGERYSRDPRNVARKAEEYLAASGVADTCFFGAEAEFYIFDSVKFGSDPHQQYHHIDSVEGWWNTGRDEAGGNLGYKVNYKGGYFPVPPVDAFQDIRSAMCLACEEMGLKVEVHHHEVATGGQAEIGIGAGTLVQKADQVQILKYCVHNVANGYGKSATFMPKPLVGDNGNGMHVHQSLQKEGRALFAGDKYGGLSDLALYYIGGVIKHAKALNAITNPGTNSYKRLVPGFEAPTLLAYSARNRSASIRIPWVSNPKARRIEVRFPDSAANPYFAFAAMMMAGLDGIQNKIHPGDPSDKDLYDLEPEEAKHIPTVCHSLDMALEHLDRDREFLTRGGVFTNDVLDAYVGLKVQELTRFRMATHPVEIEMYYSV